MASQTQGGVLPRSGVFSPLSPVRVAYLVKQRKKLSLNETRSFGKPKPS